MWKGTVDQTSPRMSKWETIQLRISKVVIVGAILYGLFSIEISDRAAIIGAALLLVVGTVAYFIVLRKGGQKVDDEANDNND